MATIRQKMQKAGWEVVRVKTSGNTREKVDEFIRQSKMTPLERMQEEWQKVKEKKTNDK